MFKDLSLIIEQGIKQVAIQVNSTLTLTYWEIGKRINIDVLQNQRAEYGKQIVATVAAQLVEKYGRSFSARNLRRMMQFADEFPDPKIVTPLVRQLSWSHFIILIPLKESAKRLFYAQKSIESSWSKRELKKQIERKVYETHRNIQKFKILYYSKQHYQTPILKILIFLIFLGLKDGYLEKDLESAIIKELENFILELGVGFSFIDDKNE